MCTAVHLQEDRLFGRTLDFESGFGEELIFTPREKMIMGEAKNRYAMLGTGILREGSSLYFDGFNEWGLAGAALNFPGYAKYFRDKTKKAELPSGLFLSFALGFCKNISEVKDLLDNVSITGDLVGEIPPSPLHWIFGDPSGTVTVESTKCGLRVIDNPYGVLTNSPDFEYHTTRLADFMTLNAYHPENSLTENGIEPYSRGMGAMGLPGDFSSASRFVRALFVKENSLTEAEGGKFCRMMHILSAVSVPLACVRTKEGKGVSTRYTSAMDLEELTYYFSSYANTQLRAVKLYPEERDPRTFPLYEKAKYRILN